MSIAKRMILSVSGLLDSGLDQIASACRHKVDERDKQIISNRHIDTQSYLYLHMWVCRAVVS